MTLTFAEIKRNHLMLSNKTAVIYGAAGSLGSAIAKAFAAAGAKVYLTGRTAAKLEKLAGEIRQVGGSAETAVVDAFDEPAVVNHLEHVCAESSSLDISINLTASEVKQDEPLVSMSVDDYMQPINDMTRSRFITAKSAANIMIRQGAGVILSLTATPGGIGYPYTGGFSGACTAIENLCTNLASEVGVYGVRVVNIRSGGSPDSEVFRQAIAEQPELMDKVLTAMKNDTMLKKMPLMSDIANLAIFLASDLANNITGVTVDITGGSTAALNYRANKPA